MKVFLELLLLVAESIFCLGISAWIGLWWIPEIAQGNNNASLATATVALIAGGSYLRKHALSALRSKQPVRFFVYIVLAGFSILGYLYGVLFKWL